MIAIVNMGPHDPKSPMGWRTYEVRINHDVIARFQHKRADGLGKCLLEASKAIERQKWESIERMNVCRKCRTDPEWWKTGEEPNTVDSYVCPKCGKRHSVFWHNA